MFVLNVPISLLKELIEETESRCGDALRITVYDASDEVPPGITTQGLQLPDTPVSAGEASFYPADFH